MTGMEILRTSSPEEIAEIVTSGHPPFCDGEQVECCRTTCKLCWLSWLNTGHKPEPTRELIRNSWEIPKRRRRK